MIRYLNRIEKQCKSEYNKNKIRKVKNRLSELVKGYKKFKEKESKFKKYIKKLYKGEKRRFGALKCQEVTIHDTGI